MTSSSTGHGRRRGSAALALLVLGGLLTACTPDAASDAGPAPLRTTVTGDALTVLDTLPVKGRAPRTGYSRDAFGQGWVDTDRNGCDTRNDVLARDLAEVVHEPGTHGCVVLAGTLDDPYTGRVVAFTRGERTSSDVQVDHVVALSDAWQKGAQQWDATRRAAFANDALELLAVDGGENQSKGDGDAATWLPPNTAYRCAYVARQVAVKARYGLWVTGAEQRAIARVLATCPDEQVPVAAAGPAAAQTTPAQTVPADGFPDCTAAWTALGTAVHRGDPGYSTRLDRDGDGTACETDPR